MISDPVAWALSLGAIAISVVLAILGWRRDARARHEELKTQYVVHLIDFIHAQTAPLLDDNWSPQQAMDATVHHAKAVGVMNAFAESQRDPDLTRLIANHGESLGSQARNYRFSGEAAEDKSANLFGIRRAALLASAARMKQQLLMWQRGELKRSDFKSFWCLYCASLLDSLRPNWRNDAG